MQVQRQVPAARSGWAVFIGRNVVERCSNRHKQWRGIAMPSDTFLRGCRAAVSLAGTLIWIR